MTDTRVKVTPEFVKFSELLVENLYQGAHQQILKLTIEKLMVEISRARQENPNIA